MISPSLFFARRLFGISGLDLKVFTFEWEISSYRFFLPYLRSSLGIDSSSELSSLTRRMI